MNKNNIRAANDDTFIKSCPFCGDINFFIDDIDYSDNEDIPENLRSDDLSYAVVCYECNARGSEEDSEQKAISAWNLALRRMEIK